MKQLLLMILLGLAVTATAQSVAKKHERIRLSGRSRLFTRQVLREYCGEMPYLLIKCGLL